MSAKSSFLEAAVLNHFLRNTSATSPTSVFVALFTTAPTESTSGTEVTGGSYARTAVTFGAPTGSPNACTQSADVTFSVATADWGTVLAYAIMDASTSGHILYFAAVSPSKAILNGDQAKISSGSIVVSEA